MKRFIFYCLLSLLIIGCKNFSENKQITEFVKSFSLDIKKYRVICFVPIDGCSSCIGPTLDYCKDDRDSLLLVLSSPLKETLNQKLNNLPINNSNLILDSKQISINYGLVSPNAPCFYILNSGHIEKIVDLSKIEDKKSALLEIMKLLSD